MCVGQAVEDGTLEDVEAKKQRKRKKKADPSQGDDPPSKVQYQSYTIYHSMSSTQSFSYLESPAS